MLESILTGLIISLIIWNLKKTEDVRKELILLHNNDLAHIEKDIKTIKQMVKNSAY